MHKNRAPADVLEHADRHRDPRELARVPSHGPATLEGGPSLFQTFDIRLLSAIARGEVDAGQLARQELANRGLNATGKWVGFDQAQRLADAQRA